jgi:hypothetical protein
MSAQAIIDQAYRSAVAAQDVCTANILRRAHARVISSIRHHAATKLTSEFKSQLIGRAVEICKARLHLVSELRRIRSHALAAGVASVVDSSLFSMFENEGMTTSSQHGGVKVATSSSDDEATSRTHSAGNILTQAHVSIVNALSAADAACFMTLPPLLNGAIGQECFLLFEPVLGLTDDDDDDARHVVGHVPTDPPHETDVSLRRFMLQSVGEEAYLRDIILPALTEDVLIGLIGDEFHGGERNADPESSPQTTMSESDEPSAKRPAHGGDENHRSGAAMSPSPLQHLLLGVSERLALRVALDDIRTNESKICRRVASTGQPSSAAVLQMLLGDGNASGDRNSEMTPQQRRLMWASPPGTLVGSPESLPYCVAVVYGTAVEVAIQLHGLRETLQVICDLAGHAGPSLHTAGGADARANTDRGTPKLNTGMVHFLLQSVLEEAARAYRTATQERNEEMEDVKRLMRNLRGLVETESVSLI